MSSTATKHSSDIVRCRVCGAEVGGGWVQGFSPSPNALKMGLCAAHDTPEQRRETTRAWQALMRMEIARAAQAEAYKSAPALWQLEVMFFEGGRDVLDCLACSAEGESLQVTLPDRSLKFFPLRQIREYTLRPLPAEASG